MTWPEHRPLYGNWLRQQRQARKWNLPEMRRQLRMAAKDAGEELPNNQNLTVMIHRWEGDRSGISERYRIHYCRAFKIPLSEFGEPASILPEPGEPIAELAAALADAGNALLTASLALWRYSHWPPK
jgi:transcriptional regulator with XRE-family HTH domain